MSRSSCSFLCASRSMPIWSLSNSTSVFSNSNSYKTTQTRINNVIIQIKHPSQSVCLSICHNWLTEIDKVPIAVSHSFILETYIAPLQETTTQRRSQHSHGQKKKDFLVSLVCLFVCMGSGSGIVLTDDFIRAILSHAILSVPFCPYHFVRITFCPLPFCLLPFCPRTVLSPRIMRFRKRNITTILI